MQMIQQSNDIAIAGKIIAGLTGATEKNGGSIPPGYFAILPGRLLPALSPHYAIAGTATG
jgi:hypothetical protein